ncbi:MAG: hypothetical protein HY287_09675 [Planctomycetes bacterium]|nr:hypothetical protein [Planctomycetota bacterium]MBI3834582.1 hypothetical protein [Planctomycetota bacterium]
MKTKFEMTREIRELNPTVSEEFLQEFSVDDLSEYLQRLHRVGRTTWIAWEPEPVSDKSMAGVAAT